MTYVRDPDIDRVLDEHCRAVDDALAKMMPEQISNMNARIAREIDELEREADEWRAQATPEELERARLFAERLARESAECNAALRPEPK